MKKFISQKGAVSIILAILLLSVLLVIGLGISILMIQQIKMSGQAGRSVVAYYAAEAGAERCLYEVRKNGAVSCLDDNNWVQLDTASPFNEASYKATYNGSDIIESTGRFRGTNRKVEASWTP
jgi:uncharacterized protein (UPF0333 family)